MKETPEKKPWIRPDLEREKVFEVNAPSCGKCQAGGPTGGFACLRLRKAS